jgi:hypothetical protein
LHRSGLWTLVKETENRGGERNRDEEERMAKERPRTSSQLEMQKQTERQTDRNTESVSINVDME